jgi:hypothetical protein
MVRYDQRGRQAGDGQPGCALKTSVIWISVWACRTSRFALGVASGFPLASRPATTSCS